MRIAFDADMLIYAAAPKHVIGQKVHKLLSSSKENIFRFGSTLLLPELLSKPTRHGFNEEVEALLDCLAQLELLVVDAEIASLVVDLGASYTLKIPDAIHLPTAIVGNTDAFVTNNTKDFDPATILEVQIVFPNDFEGLFS